MQQIVKGESGLRGELCQGVELSKYLMLKGKVLKIAMI